mgnify:FL=1
MNNLYIFFKGLKSKYSKTVLSLFFILTLLLIVAPLTLFVGYLFVTGLHDYLIQMLSSKDYMKSGVEEFNLFIASIMIYLVSFISYIFLIVGLLRTKVLVQKLLSIKRKINNWYISVLDHGKSLNK